MGTQMVYTTLWKLICFPTSGDKQRLLLFFLVGIYIHIFFPCAVVGSRSRDCQLSDDLLLPSKSRVTNLPSYQPPPSFSSIFFLWIFSARFGAKRTLLLHNPRTAGNSLCHVQERILEPVTAGTRKWEFFESRGAKVFWNFSVKSWIYISIYTFSSP